MIIIEGGKDMLNKNIKEMICIRCKRLLPIGDYYTGYPHCYEEGKPASVIPHYKIDKESDYRQLPYDTPSLLGEGHTPIVSFPNYADTLGIHSLHVKNEFQNPTGSHKDRMSKAFILHAKAQNVKGIVLASSGNAGLSAATYAASQNIPCRVIAATSLSKTMGQLIRNTGAKVMDVETSEERWDITKTMVEEENYYPCTNYIRPPVGSNLWGIQGYKTIAYEIYESCSNDLPTDILIPVSRGDLLWGIYEGFCDLKASGTIKDIPRLIAVEPIPRLSRVLEGHAYTDSFAGDYSYAPSISGDTVTYQAYKAIRDTNGLAISVSKKSVDKTQIELTKMGRPLEISSVAPFTALKDLVTSGKISKEARPLIIATSNNFFIGD